MGLGDADQSRRECRIGDRCAQEQIESPLEFLRRFLVEGKSPLKIEIVGFRRGQLPCRFESGKSCPQLRAQLFQHRGGQFILERKHIGYLRIEALRPDLIPFAGLA